MDNKKVSSYSSAGVFPVKLFHCEELVDEIQRIKPIHIQLNLTNKCNLACSFCSCQDRTKSKTMTCEKVEKVIDTYKGLGCQAITITGGGEPTLHPKINAILRYIKYSDIKVGLVTNGINIDKIKELDLLTWIRVSFDDSRHFNHDFKHNLISAVTKNRKVDWSFSYVVTKNHDYGQIIKIVDFANEYSFTHVRLVSDLLDLENVVSMVDVKKAIETYVKDDRVIYQGRKLFFKGVRNCLISLLKPVITVEGDIYPCCGTQYAHKNAKYDYNEKMKMGTWKDAEDIFYKQMNYNGEGCDRCYYNNYNMALQDIVSDLDHVEFV